ncbi:MAG: ribonuclease P protein component [Patescibacteria group bacterium]
MALVRKYRLTGKNSEYVFRKGETVKSSFFFIKFSENKIGYCRLAISVPARVSKSSVVRNRLRRMVAEIFKATGLERRPLDIIFIATPGIVGRPLGEIKSELMSVIETIFVNPAPLFKLHA